MTAKLALLFASVFVFTQFSSWSEANPRHVRETEVHGQEASKAIDDALKSITTGVNDLLSKIRGNELFQNMSAALENFGQTVQVKGKEIVERIQKAAD